MKLDVQLRQNTNSFPFITVGAGITVGGGVGLGAHAGTGPQIAISDAVNTSALEGHSHTFGADTPVGSAGVSFNNSADEREEYTEVYVSGPGIGAGIHGHDTTTGYVYNSGPNNGPGKKPVWHWPWEKRASWALGDTWNLWVGGK